MAITINREQRDAIYAEVTLDLDGIGDLAIAMNNADYETARRYRQRFEDDMRLLDDLGWEPEQNRDEFELTMPTADLARVISYFNRLLGSSVEAHLAEPEEARRHAAQAGLRADGAGGNSRPGRAGRWQLTNPRRASQTNPGKPPIARPIGSSGRTWRTSASANVDRCERSLGPQACTQARSAA